MPQNAGLVRSFYVIVALLTITYRAEYIGSVQSIAIGHDRGL